MLERLFLAYLAVSAAAGAVLLLLQLLRGPFQRHTSAAGRCALWCLLAVYLLIPFRVLLPVSPDFPISNATLGQVQTSEKAADAAQTPDFPEIGPAGAEAPSRGVTPMRLAAFLWLGGAAVFLLWQAGTWTALRRQVLEHAAAPDDAAWTHLTERIAEELGVRRPPELLVSAGAPGPMVLGFWRPVLLLPLDLEGETLGFVLRHELTHLKRGDLWRKLLLLLANGVHWFNPMVWLMLRRASLDLELACDDRMLRDAAPEERAAYGSCIVGALEKKRQIHTLTMPFYGGGKIMKTRVANILQPRKRRRGIILIAAVCVIALVLGSIAVSAAYFKPVYQNGILDMGSLFDQVKIDGRSAGMRGLSADMTPEQVLKYYGLTEEDVRIFDLNSSTCVMLYGKARIREAEGCPVSLTFTFGKETGTLQRADVTVEYLGADWDTAFENARGLLGTMERKMGGVEPFAAWNGSDRGWYIHESGDNMDELSGLDTRYTRQYMYMGDRQAGLAAVLSYQDLSRTDTTETMGVNVDTLFSFEIVLPLREQGVPG